MWSSICHCGCGEEPERGPNGQYLAHAKGHENGQVAAAFRDFKQKAFEKNRIALAVQNRAVEQRRVAEQECVTQQKQMDLLAEQKRTGKRLIW
jgi:hypothetical protein